VDYFDGRLVMVDASLLFDIPSRPFKLEDQFVKVGNYWELKDKDNPLQIHKRIRLLDRKGLIAAITDSHGNIFASKGEYDRAILEYTKAIEIDHGYTLAYFNRGVTYDDKGEFNRAILDYTKAIEIDPKSSDAYFNRGNAYAQKSEYDRAILDFTKTIEINPKFPYAYNYRGIVYAKKGEYQRAILDYDRAIKLEPQYTEVVSRMFRTFCYSYSSGLRCTIICLCLGPLKGAECYRNITPPPSRSQLVPA
jgi:tetratricopeptide (TPR) repeat protein